MNPKDEAIIKLLLHNFGELRIALDSKDANLIKSSKNTIKKFWEKNQFRVVLALNATKLVISNKEKILDYIEYIFIEISSKF